MKSLACLRSPKAKRTKSTSRVRPKHLFDFDGLQAPANPGLASVRTGASVTLLFMAEHRTSVDCLRAVPSGVLQRDPRSGTVSAEIPDQAAKQERLLVELPLAILASKLDVAILKGNRCRNGKL